MEFGRLTKVDLRNAWTREDTHFTPWLAEEENLRLLGEAIGMSLEVQAVEQLVGPFRADLLCKDADDHSLVLVENQIERTDHGHLGQVITYAAGLDAVTIVWIAKRFTDEHRAALEWLNEVSHDQIRFFGLEVELWQIGDSPVAPKFNIVARPNDWTRSVREATQGPASEHQSFRFEFWRAFLEHLEGAGSRLSSSRTPSKDHWMTWGVGRAGFHLSGVAGFRDKWCGAELVITGNDADRDYLALEERKRDIEQALSFPVTWDFKDGRKASYIRVRRENVDPMDTEQWPEIHEWMRLRLEEMDAVFRARLTS